MALACMLAAQQHSEQHFGMSLNVGLNNELYTLFTVEVRDGAVVKTSPLTREQFIQQAQGRGNSAANPDGINLFAVYGVEACTAEPDPAGNPRYIRYCSALEDLWRLRWADHPFHQMGGSGQGPGWAGRPSTPSEGQLGILAGYGLERLGGIIYGEAFFRLLRDIGDPAWVDRYRAS